MMRARVVAQVTSFAAPFNCLLLVVYMLLMLHATEPPS